MAEDSRVLGVQDLRMEFPGIYAWNSFSSPSQLSTELLADGAAVQFAIALLAQEHLQGWDCLQSPPTDGRVYSHVTKLKALLQVSSVSDPFEPALKETSWKTNCFPRIYNT